MSVQKEVKDFKSVVDQPFGNREKWSQVTSQYASDVKEHKVGSNLRMEIAVREGQEETLFFGGFTEQYPNTVQVLSAKTPAVAFNNFFDAWVDGDSDKMRQNLDVIFEYEPPKIIATKQSNDVSSEARRYLEYGLLQSQYWREAPRMAIALLNPSIATLHRVMKEKGEFPVYYTRLMKDGDMYWEEIKNSMLVEGYIQEPKRVSLQSLPEENSYYIGFSGGFDTKHVVKNFFGFEVNPYHQDSLNGILKGIEVCDNYVEMSFQKTGYDRRERYYDEPLYFRYYGDVVSAAISKKKCWGSSAYNFISTNRVSFSTRECVYDGSEVVVNAHFVHQEVDHVETIRGDDCYFNVKGEILDIKVSESPECRYQGILVKQGYVLWDRESENAAYMISRSKTGLVPMPVVKDLSDDIVFGKYFRSSYDFVLNVNGRWKPTSRYCSTHVFIAEMNHYYLFWKDIVHTGSPDVFVSLRRNYAEVVVLSQDGKPFARYRGYNLYSPSSVVLSGVAFHVASVDDYFNMKRDFSLTDIFFSRVKYGVEYGQLKYKSLGQELLLKELEVDLSELAEGYNEYPT